MRRAISMSGRCVEIRCPHGIISHYVVATSCQLLSDAEFGKDGAEDFVGGDFSGDGADVM